MTLATLRLRGAIRSLTATPSWLIAALLMLTGLGYGSYLLVLRGVTWILEYPLIGTIAPAVIQRSLEVLFLMLMAAVLFSVLVASIGTLYGSADLELLLSQPVSNTRIFAMKTLELFLNAAGLPLLLTLPVLLGVGVAMNARPLYYLVSFLAAVSLYALPVTVGALLALVLVRFAPAGRVREVATAVSIGAAAVAVLGFRMLRPEQLASLSSLTPDEFEVALGTFTRLEIGWLPPAWATSSSWAALTGELHLALLALVLTALAGLVTTGALAQYAYARGWVRSLDSAPSPRRNRGAEPASQPGWERFLQRHAGGIGAIMAKDLLSFRRDVQQWSQLLVLLALVGVYFISLAAMPLPNQQFKDALGALNIAFVGFMLAGVALRLAYPSVSYEGAAFWLDQVTPIRKRDLVLAKFLFNLPIMLALGLGLGLAAGHVLDLSPTLALAAPVASSLSAIALTGLAVGLGAAHPKFSWTNPNELVMSAGAILFMALALGHAAITTLLFARPSWIALTTPQRSDYWLSAEGLSILLILLLLTLLVTALPLAHGSRRLHRSEG